MHVTPLSDEAPAVWLLALATTERHTEAPYFRYALYIFQLKFVWLNKRASVAH